MRLFRFYHNILSQESIDKTISGGIHRQLKLLVVAIFTLLAVSAIVIFCSIRLDDDKLELGDRL